MDASVVAAMAKWPNVPDCHGWLGLDLRGRWLLQGKPVTHAGLAEFIGRNYERSESGAWFMQNGPQRVWVTLEATPWVYRLTQSEGINHGELVTHTGQPVATLRAAWLVDGEALCLESELGLGWLDDRDLPAFAERLQLSDGQIYTEEAGSNQLLRLRWRNTLIPVQYCQRCELAAIGDFVPNPAALVG